MDSKLKMILPAAATSLVALTSMLAADDMQLRNLENRVSCLEQAKTCNGMVNPPVNPPVCDGVDLFLTADALLWRAEEGGLAFAYEDQVSATSLLDSHLEIDNMHWKWGFRVGIGYNFCHDGWDTYLNWTRFHNKEDKNETVPTTGSLQPILLNSDLFVGSVSSMHAKWRLDFDTLDLELGRQFYVSKWLTLRPHMGVRGAWIDQKFTTRSTGGTVLGTQILRDSFHSEYQSAGLRGGLNTQWGMGCGWSLYGNLAFALLYGTFDLDHHETLFTTPTTPVNQMKVSKDYHLGRAATDMEFGIRWENFFCCDQYRLILQLGWEQHLYFGQNQMSRLNTRFNDNVQYNHDLSLEGFVFEARFDF